MIKTARAHRYPIWSTKAILIISLPVLVTIAALVVILSDRSLFVETQLTLLIIALCLFAFLTVGLYRGVRLERPNKDKLGRAVVEFDSREGAQGPKWADFLDGLFFFPPVDLPHIDVPHFDLGDASGVGDDLVGCLMTLVLWVAALVLIVALLWLLSQVIAALPVIILALYWIFYRALRVVFSKSRLCRGRLLPSMGYGLLYTILYTGWIFAVLWIGRFLLPGI